jgi:hypothetical protein
MNNDDNKNINDTSSSNNLNIPSSNSQNFSINTDQVVINNAKKKSSGNFILIFLVLLLILVVFNMNEIITFFEDNVVHTSPIDVGEGNSDNLIDGYVYIGDNTASLKVLDIKFYNFKKNTDKNQIRFNYISDSNYNNIANKKIYIEFYNSNKELLYKELFDVTDKINENSVNNYFIKINNDSFDKIQYAFVKTYTEDEVLVESTLVCKNNIENNGFVEENTRTFNFVNDMISKYTVEKKIIISEESNLSSDALLKLENEYNSLINLNIKTFYESGNLVYTIDYDNLNEEYVPLYLNGSTIGYIKNNEILEKWNCENG